MKNFAALAFLILLSATPVISQQAVPVENDKEVQLENLVTSVDLVKAFPNGNIVRICWPDEPVSIGVKTVLVDKQTINELLRKHNILPDFEAFGVIYTLNPDVKNLNQLEVSQLKIPDVRGGENLKQLFGDGFQVLLTSDKGLKKRFGDEVTRFNRLVERVATLDSSKFSSGGGAKAQALSELSSLLLMMRGINLRIVQRAGRPIPTEVLEQLSAEVESLNAKLESAFSSPEGTIGRAELAQTAAVKTDVEIKVKAFTETASGTAPPRWPEMQVVVRTLRQGKEILDLRVYYVPEANKEKPERARSFGKLSSPTDRRLPEADYCFWAAKDPDRTAVSNTQCEKVRVGQGAVEIQLTLLP